MDEPSVTLLWRLWAEAMVASFRREAHWEARLTATSALVITGDRRPEGNLLTLDAAPDAAETLRAYFALLGERRLPFAAYITDRAEAQVRPLLDVARLLHLATVPLMLCAPSAALQPGAAYTFEIIRDEAGLRSAARVLASAFAEPPTQAQRIAPLTLVAHGLTRFLARLDGVPVSTVTMSRAGEIAGIWGMGTARQFQGQGAGRALLEHAMGYEQAAGARWFFLGTSAEGRALYEKVGFRDVGAAGLWVSERTPAGGLA